MASQQTPSRGRQPVTSAQKNLTPEMFELVEKRSTNVADLDVVGRTLKLGPYVKAIFERRHFLVAGARGQTMAKHQNDRLGTAWLVFRPMLDAAFYFVIFALVLNVSRGVENYVGFLLVGVFMFQFSSRCIISGPKLIANSKTMIRAFAFPRASLAVSTVLRELMMSVPAWIVMVVLIMALPVHALPNWLWLLFPIILALQTVLNLGLVLLFARFGSAFPDLAQLVSVVMRLMMYASTVIFPAERFEHIEAFRIVVEFNPLASFLSMYRDILLYSTLPDLNSWLYAAAWAFGALFVGFLVFWKAEISYGRD